MLIFHKIKQLCKAALVGLLVSFLWFQAPSFAVEETPVKDADTAPYLKSESVKVKSADTIPSAEGARLQAVLDCIPEEVTRKNDDIQERVAQAFGEMGNDYLERTFGLTDSPELNEAEKEFESCLKSKDLLPLREASS